MSSKIKIDSYKISGLKDVKKMSISLEYVTRNKDFNLEYWKKSKDKHNELKFLEELFQDIINLTSKTFMECMGQDRRKGGIEKINKINFDSEIKISNDESIYSKRIMNQYRMLFVFRNDIIYVIGFDFNFSAYRHR